MASRVANTVALLAFAPVSGSTSCFIEDQMYAMQPGAVAPTPIFVQSPEDCQAHCKMQSLTCSYFSYSTQPDKEHGIFTPGGCWLFGNTASLEEGSGFIAGPAECPSANTTEAPVVAVVAGPQIVGEGETCNPTVAPAYQKKCKEGLECVTAEADKGMMGASGTCKEVEKVSTAPSKDESDEDTGGGGFPIWGYILIALAVVGIAGAAYFMCAKKKAPKGSKAKDKKKRAAKVSAATVTPQDVPNSIAETEPLIRPEAEPAQQPLPVASAMPTVPMQSAMSMQSEPRGSLVMQQMPSQQMPVVSGHVMPVGSQMMPMPMYSQMMQGPVQTTPLGSLVNPYANNPYAQPAQPVQSYPFVQPGPMAEPGAAYPSAMGAAPQFVYR